MAPPAAVGAELLAARHGVYWVAATSAAALAIPNLIYSHRLRQVIGFAALPTPRLATLRAGLARVRGLNPSDPRGLHQ